MVERISIDSMWKIPEQLPTLRDSGVHLWRTNLALSTPEVEQLTGILSPDEIARANRFHFPTDKNRFIVTRGILRQLLGNYLGENSRSLEFTYSDRGKPQLKNDSPLQFNLSHSQDYALFGFTLDHLIGVDLEYQKAMPDALKLAQRFFAPSEYQLLEELPKEEQPQLFFQLWTAKEAYLKALGIGLSGSLADAEIGFDQNKALYLFNPVTADRKAPWSLFSCSPASNYLGAIAINSQIAPQDLNYWSCSTDLS